MCRVGSKLFVLGGKNTTTSIININAPLKTNNTATNSNSNVTTLNLLLDTNNVEQNTDDASTTSDNNIAANNNNTSSNTNNSNIAQGAMSDIWAVNTAALPLSLSKPVIDYKELKIEQEIGVGNFSKVMKYVHTGYPLFEFLLSLCRGVWKGQEVAVKKLTIKKNKDPGIVSLDKFLHKGNMKSLCPLFYRSWS
jgi:hypothetical protein